MTEADVQKQIMEFLMAHDFTVIRLNAGRGRYNQRLAGPGTPDLLVIDRYGLISFIEVKGPTGKLRDVQVDWIDRHRKRGVNVVVAHELADCYSLVD